MGEDESPVLGQLGAASRHGDGSTTNGWSTAITSVPIWNTRLAEATSNRRGSSIGSTYPGSRVGRQARAPSDVTK